MLLEFKLWLENTIAQLVGTDPKVSEFYKNIQQQTWFPHFQSINPQILEPLKKWIAYHSVYTDPNIAIKLMNQHVLFEPQDKYNLKQKLNRLDYTIKNIESDNESYHKNLAKVKNRTYSEPTRALEELSPINNLQWVSLDKKYCQTYGNTMGHCGNAAAKVGDNILSLMDAKTNMHYLTFIVNNGILGESKSQMNQKPSSKYHPNIKQLLLSPYVKIIKGLGYKPENNFQFSDLTPQDQQSILVVKPHMDNYVGHINAETGKNSKYIEEDNHYLFDKNISNKEFEELVDILLKDDLSIWGPNDEEGGVGLVSIAREFKNRRLPLNPKIYEEIVKNSFASYYYVINYLEPKNTPVELIKSLARNPEYGMSYAVDILKGKNVPNVILDKIIGATDQESNLGNYVQKLMAKNYPIIPWHLRYLKINEDIQVQFYYSWKEALDHGLVDRIPDEAYELISKQAAFRIINLLNREEIENFDPRIFKIAKFVDSKDYLATKRKSLKDMPLWMNDA